MRTLLGALILLPAATFASANVSDVLACSIAKGLAGAAALLAPTQREAPEVYVESEVDFAQPPPQATAAKATRPAQRQGTARAPVPRKGVRVSARRVLQLANAGARPSGVFVPARGERPAGLALVGVSALGVGLNDGDVLTHAGGRPATSVSSIVGMILGARAKRAPELSGRFWRRGEAWNLLVEQPYLGPTRERSPATASLDPSRDTETGPNRSKARASSVRP